MGWDMDPGRFLGALNAQGLAVGAGKTLVPFSKGLLKSLLGNKSGLGGKSDRGADGALCQPALKIHMCDGLFQISPGRMSSSLPGHAGKALRLPPRAGATRAPMSVPGDGLCSLRAWGAGCPCTAG